MVSLVDIFFQILKFNAESLLKQDNVLFRASVWAMILALNVFLAWYPHHLTSKGLQASWHFQILYQVLDKPAVTLLFAWLFYNLAFGYFGKHRMHRIAPYCL